MTYQERQLLFKRCRSYLDGDDYPISWFQSPTDTKKQNIILWILWALFSTETYQPEWEEEINGYLLDIESLLGRKLEGGYSETAKCMRVTFDPVVTLHRPLVWYAVSFSEFITRCTSIYDLCVHQIIGVVDFYSSLSIRAHGFKHYTTPKWFRCFPPRPQSILSETSADHDLSYWYRPHRSTEKLPILFLHGIGV